MGVLLPTVRVSSIDQLGNAEDDDMVWLKMAVFVSLPVLLMPLVEVGTGTSDAEEEGLGEPDLVFE